MARDAGKYAPSRLARSDPLLAVHSRSSGFFMGACSEARYGRSLLYRVDG